MSTVEGQGHSSRSNNTFYDQLYGKKCSKIVFKINSFNLTFWGTFGIKTCFIYPELVYRDPLVPEQWLIPSIIPVHKKGDKTLVENYRPVANLCYVSKFFKKLILKRNRNLKWGFCWGQTATRVHEEQEHCYSRSDSTVINCTCSGRWLLRGFSCIDLSVASVH